MNKTNKTTSRLSEDEDSELEARNRHLPYAESQIAVSSIRVHLDEAFKEPSYYRAIVDRLSNCTSNDQVTFYVSSKGGHLDGLVSLMHAVKYTEANVTCIIVGEALSAGSMFALSCPNIAVSDNATMMVHHVSFGSVGKAADVHAQTQFTLKFCEDLFKSIYQGFLTPSEIEQCLTGKELWFDSKEIIRRLEIREKFRAKPEKSASRSRKKSTAVSTE
jgi:ATP-dependent protease ClpP protease subunit